MMLTYTPNNPQQSTKKNQITTVMSNYSSSSSIFSCDFKIPYEQSSLIAEHLEESQQQINYIKVKLTQAFEKLQCQIKTNTQLEHDNEHLITQLQELNEKYKYECMENDQLKQTLQVILKNRKMMQLQIQQLESSMKTKLMAKDQLIQQLKAEHARKMENIMKDYQIKCKEVRELQQLARQHQVSNDLQDNLSFEMQNKLLALQTEIARLTEQKITETTRLRKEIMIYQRNVGRVDGVHRKNRINVQQQFGNYDEDEENKQNENGLQMQNVEEDSMSKWKRMGVENMNINRSRGVSRIGTAQNQMSQIGSKCTMGQMQSVSSKISQGKVSESKLNDIHINLTEDQQLTACQTEKKVVQQQLSALDKIKRPSPDERRLIEQLEQKIYNLNSNIARLKRKIRGKY